MLLAAATDENGPGFTCRACGIEKQQCIIMSLEAADYKGENRNNYNNNNNNVASQTLFGKAVQSSPWAIPPNKLSSMYSSLSNI